MTLEEQNKIINMIKEKSAENDRHNTVRQTKLEGFVNSLNEVISKLSDEQRQKLDIDITRLNDKDYVEDLRRRNRALIDSNNRLFDKLAEEGLTLLGMVGR